MSFRSLARRTELTSALVQLVRTVPGMKVTLNFHDVDVTTTGPHAVH